MMAVPGEAIPLIREYEGVEVDLARLPPDDLPTHEMMRRADTIGVFQIESRAQMATLPRLKPERFTISSSRWRSSPRSDRRPDGTRT
jgi:error-prone DNA polymerase